MEYYREIILKFWRFLLLNDEFNNLYFSVQRTQDYDRAWEIED